MLSKKRKGLTLNFVHDPVKYKWRLLINVVIIM